MAHSHKDYKGATGVRARSDLSANAKPADDERMSLDTVARCADWLAGEVREAQRRKRPHVQITTQTANRLVAVMIEVVNRGTV